MNPEVAYRTEFEDLVELAIDSEISSIKDIVTGIVRIINDPRSTAKDLNEIIRIDPPLTSRVLRLANSSYYSPRNMISEITRAVIWIGYDALKELVLSQKVCQLFNRDHSYNGYSRKALWRHSLAVALLGKTIYRREFGERGENIYAAGLLHDIGFIVLDQFRQDEFIYTLNKVKNEKKNLIRAELEVFGFDHSELGKAIMNNWNIPEELCMAIGGHHNPSGVRQNFSKMVKTLYVADSFCQEKGMGYGNIAYKDKNVFQKCLMDLNLSLQALELIIEDVEEQIRKMENGGFFK